MKTKVIAFRVTEEEFAALNFYTWRAKVKMSDLIRAALDDDIAAAMENMKVETKRLEIKAKRAAKKAAAQVVPDGNA